MEIENNIIKYIKISGDFFMFPQNAINNLEEMLINVNINNVNNIIKEFYNNGIITPSVDTEDFIKAMVNWMDGRILYLEVTEDTRMSLAYDEALYRKFNYGDKPILRFYRHDKSVIIGYFQIGEQEVYFDYMKKNNIMLARRYTGAALFITI